jgi:DNA-binding SARP family transcriptional activator/WD40 repeat protein
MDFRILGPLEVLDEGRVVALAGAKQRALLALLLLHADQALSTERLIDELWGEQPPAAAAKALQAHIWRLRRALADGTGDGSDGLLVTRQHGYQLELDPDRLDAHRFERLVAEGRDELAAGRPARAVSALEEALALWRGPALADLSYEHFAQREIARLEDLQIAALEQLIEARLDLGRHDEVVPQLETLIREHPYRERLRAQLMLALHRCDRQADALQAYQDARRQLAEELGIEPGERLRELERAILAQDSALLRPAAGAVELPPELDASTLLAGREADLEWLREHWRGALAGAGRVVVLLGARGMGKTRLAAELAAEARRDGGEVLYGSGTGPREAVRALLAGAGAARRPTLVVLDDVDRAGGEVPAAVDELALAAVPALVLATAADPALAASLRADATLRLAPLEADGVRAVARLYTGAYAEVEIPVQRLAAVSEGVPARLHRAAREWARAETARRLGAAAGRAASERTDLRAAETDLAGDVIALQALSERAEPQASETGVVVCPFKGLASFDVEDAEFFFGRERLVAEMVARVAGAPLLGVVGASGSGKSSALRAGLLAALAAGVLPGSDRWPVALLRPGEHPLRALEQATDQAGSDRRVIAVDQFEETFTACRDQSERTAFVDALVAAALYERRPALLLVAVRADFYGNCAAYPELARLLGANHVLVGPMRRDELRRAIELPAQLAGLEVERDLVDALIADVEAEPGGLPLLSAALLELWQHRDGRALRLHTYQHTGGVHGAVARLAERAYQGLDDERRELARRVLLRLAGAGEGDAVVRRRVPLAELEADRDERIADVLAALAADRLVTIGAGEVEVAHEALLREWPRLRGWLEEDAEGRRLHRQLGAAAREWDAGGRDAGDLYRGARLASALDWSAAHESELNQSERAFLADSRAASERSQRRLRMGLVAMAGLVLVAAIAGVLALRERGHARDEAVAADAQRLGAQALVEDNLDRSLLLAREGVALDDSALTRGNLLAALLKSPAAIGVLRGGDRLTSLDLSPDGRTLAFLDDDATLHFIDTRTRRPAARPQIIVGGRSELGTNVSDLDRQTFGSVVQFSDDGSLLAIGGDAPVVIDARTHRVLARLPNFGLVYRLRFSPDGRTVFAAIGGPPVGSTIIRRFDARSGRTLGRERYVSLRPNLVSLMLTRDGRRVVTTSADGPTVIRDARTLRPLKRLPFQAEQAALSPDGRTMLAGGSDGSVRFVDLVTGAVHTGSGRRDGEVVRAVFSADGRTAVTAAEDNRAIVWDVERATGAETLEGHAGRITGVEATGDGKTLYTASLDGTVLTWDLGNDRRLDRPFDLGGHNQVGVPLYSQGDPALRHPILSYAMRPDGRVLAAGHGDGTVTLIDAATLEALTRFRAVPRGPVRGIAYVPGERLLVVTGDHGFLALVEPGSGRLVARLRGHRFTVLTPSLSSDGRLMATVSGGDTVKVWSLRSGQPPGRPRSYSPPPEVAPTDASLSPDGRSLAVTSTLGIEILDVATLRPRLTLPGSETVRSLVRFTPDGRFVVGGSSEGWTRLWSTETWRPATRPLAGHAGEVLWQSTSPDGRTLATGSTDGAVRLFDVRTEQPLGAPLPGLPNRPVAPQFTPDGAFLFAITDAGRAYRWDVRPSSWARHACAVAGRTLTRSEWEDALPGRDYTPACAR